MSEQSDTQSSDASKETADKTAADSATDKPSDSQDQARSDESDKKADESGKGKSDSDNADSGDKKEQSGKQDSQDAKPSNRRSAAFRINQLTTERDEWKAKAEAKNGAQKDTDAGDDQYDDGSQADKPNSEVDRRLKTVEKASELVLTQAQKSADDAEISDFFSGDRADERKVYEPKIRKMWGQDQYKDLPASDLYKIAAFEEAQRKGAEAAKKAAKEAKESSTGGNNSSANRNGGAAALPSDEEILRRNQQVIAGRA